MKNVPALFGPVLALAAAIFVCGGAAFAADPEPASATGFSLVSLRGSYAMEFSGRYKAGDQWISMVGTGLIAADGNGHLQGNETYSTEARVCEASVAGSYTIGADGRGTGTFSFKPTSGGCNGGGYTQSLVLAKGGELVLLANSKPGELIEERWYRQKPQPGHQ